MRLSGTVAASRAALRARTARPSHLPRLSLLSAPSSRLSSSIRLNQQTFLPRTTTTTTSAARLYSSSPLPSHPLRKTPLYDLHVAHGAKMVPYGSYHMPVLYSGLSVSASHIFTRERASLFDVGHMVQRLFRGPAAAAFLERVTPAGASALAPHRSTLSTLLHPGTGGIVDDTVITKLPDGGDFYVVTNAACRDKDDAYFARELEAFERKDEVAAEEMAGFGLVAVQGPLSAEIVEEVLAEPEEVRLKELYFGSSTYARLKLPGGRLSSPVLISRGGYTGEDGFEISIPGEETVAVTEALLATGTPERLQLAGLGARDSLRLEAGLCLYGNDLDDTITPVEAGLSWIIPKERRNDHTFHGADVILKQLVPKTKGGAGVDRRRVGLVVDGAPAREGAEILSSEGEKIGTITSGCPSPTLNKNISMGYIKDGFHKAGTEVSVVVRGRSRQAVVTKMPFVPTKYWKGTAPA